MRAIVEKLHRDIRDVLSQIELFRILNDLAAADFAHDAPHKLRELHEHLTSWGGARRMQHSAVVVGLYGCLERFVEELIESYVSELQATIPRYSLLPERIKSNHTSLSASLLDSSLQGRAHDPIDPARVVARLHSCLHGDGSPYELNAEAFSQHTANYRIQSIEEGFTRAGVPNVANRLASWPSFYEFVKGDDPSLDPARLRREELYEPLQILADKRNDVSHGVDSGLLSLELLLSTTRFVQAFGVALGELLETELAPYEVSHCGQALGRPIVVHGNRIVCLELEGVSIQRFDKLIATVGGKSIRYKSGLIEEIQIDGETHEVLDIPTGAVRQVALRVGYHAKPNYDYTLVSQIAKGAG